MLCTEESRERERVSGGGRGKSGERLRGKERISEGGVGFEHVVVEGKVLALEAEGDLSLRGL